ncbi:hypothetical protein ACVW1B_004352 [Bradyrhizobium sp. USDA 4502]
MRTLREKTHAHHPRANHLKAAFSKTATHRQSELVV